LLGWRPNEFWTATPAELAACLESPIEDAEPMNGAVVAKLRQQFPD
jgi:hypothetical protein